MKDQGLQANLLKAETSRDWGWKGESLKADVGVAWDWEGTMRDPAWREPLKQVEESRAACTWPGTGQGEVEAAVA